MAVDQPDICPGDNHAQSAGQAAAELLHSMHPAGRKFILSSLFFYAVKSMIEGRMG